MKHIFFFCIAAALTLAACTNDDENLNGGPVAAQVTAGIDVTQTRASGTAWADGDHRSFHHKQYTDAVHQHEVHHYWRR